MHADRRDWRSTLVSAWARAQDRSVVGPGDPSIHLRLAETLAQRLDTPALAADLGSGAGIPGLALAGIWPQSHWLLVDAARRRANLLDETVEELGWADRVTVVHGRAEDVGREPAWRGRFDLVTARSFGPPAVTAECGVGLLRPGGILAVTEPPDADGSRWPGVGLAALGLTALPPEPGLQQLRLDATTDDRFPRRAGVPAKRPIF